MIGNSLTHYRITAKLGAGGMGEVYRATDTKLGREVAIKVLPASISRDATSLARFEREAKALAALNHPHIAAIHGFDADQGTHFLVLELVEGQTLSERLRRGRLPVDEALRVARQIAEAVEAAHAKGIIHRDLKPGNIKLTPEGRVKVLDFGLAKMEASVRGQATPASDPEAPTLLAETTQPGAVMGTPAYMSPEQARGQEVDKRTDVWAFGCCLFECLAGSKPFRGATVTDLMSEVLKSEPEWAALPAEVPREVATLLRRCLEKEPRRRLSSLGDIALLLEDSTQSRQPGPITPTATETKRPPEPSKRPSLVLRMTPWIAVLVLGVAVAVLLLRRPAASATRASQIRSLAVLPFAFETQDPKLSGLGKWIPAEIRSKLGPLQNLQVVNSPARIEQLVQQKKSEVEIARELGVDGLVMGELHGQGETMSAYVWVVDGATGRALGKQREIASSASKVSELPNQVALAIVDELKLQVSTSERTEIQVAETQNAEAFLAYQKGRDLMSSRLFDKAAVELRRAYQLDTNYTRAWNALAESEWVPLIFGGTTNEMATIFKRLSGEAERFHAQRPDDPALASLRMRIATIFERDWNKVSAIFWESQRDQKPDSAVLRAMAWYYAFIEGHPEPALHTAEQAIALDPENLMNSIIRANQLFNFGRYDDAVRAFRSLPPEKIRLEDYSFVLLKAGDLAGAKEVATRVLAGRPSAWTQCSLAAIHAKSGAGDEARKILRALDAQAEQGLHIPYAQIAWSYGMLGDFESARRWLRQGLLEGHGDWSMLSLRTADKLEMFGKLAWYWEIVDGMKFPPLQMDHPYFALEQAMRYGRGTVGAPTTGTSTNEPPKTLAVLPFVNMSADKDNEYFSDGITEEILNALARTPGLRVAARTSAFSFKGKNESMQRIGEALKVGVLLEGSVRREGSQLRITAQLINVADGFHLWSDTFDRKAEDLFAIQTEVAQKVTEVLKVKLLAGSSPNATLAGTDNLEAYDLYLRGRELWNKRTGTDSQRAVGLFQQATEKDPKFAAAYAALGSSYVLLPEYAAVPVREAIPKARAAARRALELDGRLAEAHAVLGQCALNDWDLVGAEQEYQQALRLNPNHATSHQWYSLLLTELLGKPDEALAEIRKAQALDPLSAVIQVNIGMCLNVAGRYEEALVEYDKALKLSPDFLPSYQRRGRTLLVQTKIPDAIAEFEKIRKIAGDTPYALGYLGNAFARAGRTNEARQILGKLKSVSASGSSAFGELAFVNLGLGDLDQAFVWLERGAESRDLDPRAWKFDPLYGEVIKDPRYAALLKKYGLDK